MANGKTKRPADSDEDDIPLAKQRAAAKRGTVTKTVVRPAGYSSDSDQPLVRRLAADKLGVERKAGETAKKLRAEATPVKNAVTGTKRKIKKEEPESEGELTSKPKKVAKKINGVKKEDSDDEPLTKKATPAAARKTSTKKAAVKETEKTPTVKSKRKVKKEESPQEEEEEEEEEEFKWWEMEENDGSTKWKTLEHNGVVFPPPYEPLPSHVKLKYEGNPVTLPLEAEEVAGFFGAMLNNSSTHTGNPRFVANFFKDFQSTLKAHGGARSAAGKVRIGFPNTLCVG